MHRAQGAEQKIASPRRLAGIAMTVDTKKIPSLEG